MSSVRRWSGSGANGCGGTSNDKAGNPPCSDGVDNDRDGLIDFPDDPGCTSANGSNEAAAPSPQCSDGRDNDGDGKIDYPYDPGCLEPRQDSETDDCPDGPNCPKCSNGKDDDGNGLIDFPDDPGCLFAGDNDEYLDNPAACGNDVMVEAALPFDGHVHGSVDASAISYLSSTTCGGAGGERVYELRITHAVVVTATTDLPGTNFDTVLYVRPKDCTNPMAELACNDDFTNSTVDQTSSMNVSLTDPGTYYLVVDSHDAATSGTFEMQVNFLNGEGVACADNSGCGPGLVCRIPVNESVKVCAKHVCSDGVDDDGDGKLDYPTDPGCDSPTDDDESDTCPGTGCPVCSDGVDNDGDGETDYPNDTNCESAAGMFESCSDVDPIQNIVGPTTTGTTVGLHNDGAPTCGSSTNTAPDKALKLSLPGKVSSLTITTTVPSSFDAVTAVYGPSCHGTSLACSDFSPITLTDLNAGDLYVVVDGYAADSGTYSIGVTGLLKVNESCEGPLVTSGALACGPTAACAGAVGMKKCVPAQCSDGMDNDNDGKIDYPFDPGCSSPGDNTETDPATAPVCSNGTDNDADGLIDFPADYGCSSAGGTSEVFCASEHDPTSLITGKTTTSTTVGKANDHPTSTCQSSATGPDIAYGLYLPVPVASLVIDTNGSSFDTVLSFEDTQCTTSLTCDDDGGDGAESLIRLTNLNAGNYAVIVDGYSGTSGTVTLNVNGVVTAGTACTSTAFNATTGYLKCPTACTAGVCQ